MSAGDVYFNVSYSARVTDSIRAAGERARAVGRAREVRDAVRLFHDWLRSDPETLGEPYRVHKSRELTEYIGFVGPLVVRYLIRHESRHVLVVHPIRIARRAGF